jgi:hypothetical protein
MIDEIDRAAKDYPYPNEYGVARTQQQHVHRLLGPAGAGLQARPAATAIGRTTCRTAARRPAPGGRACRFRCSACSASWWGPEEGLEINVLGLTFGVDPMGLALKLPAVGRVGWPHDG